ncbi:MAG TPA: hypothetical protein V6C81_22680 [Planktothrix sp.]|jgi:hypothetical protein
MPGHGIPLALSESSSLVWAEEKLDYADYFCARCHILLNFDERSCKFSHPDSPFCSDMQSVQRSAIIYLKKILDQRKGCPVQARVACRSCRALMILDIAREYSACQIVPTDDDKVALLVDGFSKLLFIVRPASSAALAMAKAIGARSMEVDPRNILSHTPIQILSERAGDFYCETCNRSNTHILTKIGTTSDKFDMTYDPARYRTRLYNCWKCREEILVFRWKEEQHRETEDPPEPRPVTVQWRWSQNHQTFSWVNTCPACDAVQGDSYVVDKYFGLWY